MKVEKNESADVGASRSESTTDPVGGASWVRGGGESGALHVHIETAKGEVLRDRERGP